MSERQTLGSPNIDWHIYSKLEQRWEDNYYRLNTRIKNGEGIDTVGDLRTIIWTDEEVNAQLWENVINISENEQFERILDKQINERYNEINLIYTDFRDKNPYIEKLKYNDLHGGEIYAVVNKIKDFIKEHNITEKDLPHLTKKLHKVAEDKWLKLEIKKIGNLKKSYWEWWFILDITRIDEEKIMQEYIEQQTTECANTLIEIYEEIENLDDKDKKSRKNRYWGKESFNVYKNEEWKKVIHELVRNDWANTKLLLHVLKQKLEILWFESSRPAYDYFLNENMSEWWFSIERKTESLKTVA